MNLPQLKRIRWGVRAVLVLGVAASVVANILHANPNPISQTIAAWPPLALLLTVELISRVPVHRRSLAAVRVAATVTIAGIAAWVSYWHMAGVVARYGETGAAPYLMPFSVDGLVVVASVCLVELAGHIRATAETVAPVAVEQAAPAVTVADKTRPVKRTAPRPPGRPSAAAKVAAAVDKTPDAKPAEIAKRAGVSTKTVRRHLTDKTPAIEVDKTPGSNADAQPVNGATVAIATP